MTERQESTQPARDSILIAVSAVLAVAGVVAFYWLSAQALPWRLAALLLPVALAVAALLGTTKGRQGLDFLRETNIEVRKVVWPTRQETLQTTGVVFVAVVISAIFLWGLDSALALTVKTLTGRGG
jgi:preprotein translocase subunit SecE